MIARAREKGDSVKDTQHKMEFQDSKNRRAMP